MICKISECKKIALNTQKVCPQHLIGEICESEPPTSRYFYHQLYYTQKWTSLRDKKRILSPLCAHCEKIGEEVDHIIDHRGNLELFYDYENLQTLCTPCHSRKTLQKMKHDRLIYSTIAITINYNKDCEIEKFQKSLGLEMNIINFQVLSLLARSKLSDLSRTGKMAIYTNKINFAIMLIEIIENKLNYKLVKKTTYKPWRHILT